MVAACVHAQSVETVPFTETLIDVPAKVHFVRGNGFAFSVEAGDPEVARQLQCSVKNGVLKFNYGKALKAGEVSYNDQSETYYYGVAAAESESLAYDGGDVDYIITIVSPAMPEVKTSADYEMASLVRDTESRNVAMTDK